MIQIDYRDGRPIYEQIVDGIERLALQGALEENGQLPSVRQLAVELSINPNTIQRAFGELEQRGVIYSSRGRGNFLAEDFSPLRERRLGEIGKQVCALVASARELGAEESRLQGWLRGQKEAEI